VTLPGDRGVLLCHARHPADVAAIQKVLAELDPGFDLAEPFSRVKEAIAEGRKMGVSKPAA